MLLSWRKLVNYAIVYTIISKNVFQLYLIIVKFHAPALKSFASRIRLMKIFVISQNNRKIS